MDLNQEDLYVELDNTPLYETLEMPERKKYFADVKSAGVYKGLAVEATDLGEMVSIETSDGKVYESLLDFFHGSRDGQVYACFEASDLDILVKYLGEEKCRSLYEGTTLRSAGVLIRYTPSRLLTMWESGKVVRINSLKYWFRQFELDKSRAIVGLPVSIEAKSVKTLELWAAIWESTKDLWRTTRPALFYSPSLISKPIVDTVLAEIDLEYIPQEAQEMAYNCIHAPWVDIFTKGVVHQGYDYDLNSAYPTELMKLPSIDYLGGEWFHSDQYEKKTKYGFCYALITVYEGIHASPIKVRYRQRLYSPTGSWIGYITKAEIDFLHRWKLGEVEVFYGWWFRTNDYSYKPFRRGAAMYIKKRASARTNGDLPAALALKLAAASIYGRFLQKRQNLDGSWVASGTFCPIYACIVMTEVKLRIAYLTNKLGKSVASVNVDGIITEETLDYRTVDISNLKLAYEGEVTLVAPLLYTIEGRDSVFDFPELIEENLDSPELPIGSSRRVGLCEALSSGNFSLVGSTSQYPSTLSVSAPYARAWEKSPVRASDLKDGIYRSRALHIEEIVWRDWLEDYEAMGIDYIDEAVERGKTRVRDTI